MKAVLDPEPAVSTSAVRELALPRGPLGVGRLPFSGAIERRTFFLGVQGSVLEGLFGGVFSLNAYVALRSLGGAEMGYTHELAISTLIPMLPSVAMAFAMLYNKGGEVRRRRGYFLYAAFLGRLSLVAAAFIGHPYLFVAMVGVHAVACAGIPPSLNQIWGANFSQPRRGRLFALFSSAGMLMVMLCSPLAARILDRDPENYRILYPIAGVLGTLSMLTFWRIRLRYREDPDRGRGAKTPLARMAAPARRSLGLLLKDRHFRIYEVGYFTYGIAFMMLIPVVPVLFHRYLEADYAEFSGATVVVFQAVVMVMAPIVARFAEGRSVTAVTGGSFAVLLLYPAMLLLTALTRSMAFAYAAFVVFGVAMSGVHYTWNLGPVAFARGGNALSYTSTHAMLVGFRAMVGFPLGFLLMWLFPDQPLPVFAAATGLLLAAVAIMWRLGARMRREG